MSDGHPLFSTARVPGESDSSRNRGNEWRPKRWRFSAICCLALSALSGCGNGSGTAGAPISPPVSPPVSPPPPQSLSIDDGRYVGTVTIDGTDYFADAIFAPNGETHLYIGGPYTDSGTIQLASPGGSINFYSPARTISADTVSGQIIGGLFEFCGEPGSPSDRWCGQHSAAQLTVERVGTGQTGVIHGAITGHGETWITDLTSWSAMYNLPARLSDLRGQYAEEYSSFSPPGFILTIDEDGRAFFQSSWGCTGNGMFVPLGNGSADVFSVTMSVANCVGIPMFLLNAVYRGLATISPSDYWGYDTNLRIWLTTPSNGAMAVTLWGQRIPGS